MKTIGYLHAPAAVASDKGLSVPMEQWEVRLAPERSGHLEEVKNLLPMK